MTTPTRICPNCGGNQYDCRSYGCDDPRFPYRFRHLTGVQREELVKLREAQS